MNEKDLSIPEIILSADRRKVFLRLKTMKPNHVIYVRLNYKTIKSYSNNNLWTTEAWYTINNIPAEPGNVQKSK